MSNGSASSITVCSPAASRRSIVLRVGFASAPNVALSVSFKYLTIWLNIISSYHNVKKKHQVIIQEIFDENLEHPLLFHPVAGHFRHVDTDRFQEHHRSRFTHVRKPFADLFAEFFFTIFTDGTEKFGKRAVLLANSKEFLRILTVPAIFL